MNVNGSKNQSDYIIEQDWDRYTEEQHDIWSTLFERQRKILHQRACDEFIEGLEALDIVEGQIPKFERLTQRLKKRTNWEIVAVPGLVPDDIFFKLLSERKFPSTCFIRRRDQMDYLQEPDIFHDIYGHVPLLANPIFANYMEQYGKGGLKALKLGHLDHLARLYWYTVEFGLIQTKKGLRIYGSGITSSKGESIYCLEDQQPHRILFDLMRVMRTKYKIDDFQEIYFVINSFEELFDATLPDFTNYYKELESLKDFEPSVILKEDQKILI